MAVRAIVHVSDLHFGRAVDGDDGPSCDGLVDAAKRIFHELGSPPDLLAITGDVFDDPKRAMKQVASFVEVLRRLRAALGGGVQTAIVPGNHDRRTEGVFHPWTNDLFFALREALAAEPGVTVFGSARSATEYADAASDAIGLDVVALDSTRVRFGLASAGGVLAPEDILSAAQRLRREGPVVFMLHHHLIPTPVTDASRISMKGRSRFQRLVLGKVLPQVLSFADHEELTMTVLGAGTALSLLHALDRPVVVLHGHKHYPTARVLAATRRGEADVMLISAGSAGVREDFAATNVSARLSTSLNVVRWSDGALRADTWFFASGGEHRRVHVRPLLDASVDGNRWAVHPVDDPPIAKPRVASDTAAFKLSGFDRDDGRDDLACDRAVEAQAGEVLSPWKERIEGAVGCTVDSVLGDIERDGDGPPRLVVKPGAPSSYVVHRGICRTRAALRASYGPEDVAPFEWVGLTVRHGCANARLSIRGLSSEVAPFGSVTDLHTGRQWPAVLEPADDGVALVVAPCPAGHLLRIHWEVPGPDETVDGAAQG